MAGKLSGNAIVSGSVTSTQLSSSVNNSIAQGGGPKITQIQITDSSYNVLDDTAVSTSGGYIKITGTGFNAGAVVIIGTVNATSTAYVSSTTLNVQVPAAVAGTYVVYVVNTDGGTAIAVNGLTYSALPNWVTGSTLPSGTSSIPISIQLNATDATNYALAAGNTLPSGLTLTSGGLLSGTVTVGVETVYSFTVVATDAQLQDSPRAFTITIIVGDPYFYLTSLLIPGNGTNNGTNNTFLDSSTNNYTITRAGNSTQGTFSPFSLTGWSNYFDGVGDRLSVSGNSAFNISSGDFTVEGWIYPRLSNATQGLFVLFTATNANYAGMTLYVSLQTSSAIVVEGASPSIGGTSPAFTITTTNLAPNNTWTHVAVTRSGNTFTVWINGVSSGTATFSGTLYWNPPNLYIGSGNDSAFNAFFGYISNFRIVKGTAVYTTNFTPSTTPLTTIANTSVLTCQSNRLIDNSTNNFTITKTGDVSVQSASPFVPGSAYSTSTVGGSVYLDGTGDYLSTVTTPANFGSGDFTIETWVWFNTNSAGYQPILTNTGSGDLQGWVMITETTNILWFLSSTNGSSWTNTINTNIIPTTKCWTHLAVVRNGSTITYYVNGVAAATNSIGASSLHAPSNAFYTGYYPYFPGGARAFNGYFSGTRLVNGTAVYTSNFTPPTAPPTPVANTSLLQNYTNGQIIDATSKNDLETIADAKISTAQSKWGGSSMYFDGNGDYLFTRGNNTDMDCGTGDYTFECWIYISSRTLNYPLIFGNNRGSFTTNALAITASNSDNASYNDKFCFSWGNNGWSSPSAGNSATLVANVSNSINTWYHFAVVRNGTSVKMYRNGVEVASATILASNSFNWGFLGTFVGGGNWDGAQSYFNGYINDLRFTKGYARYTTNFTPPSSAFPTL